MKSAALVRGAVESKSSESWRGTMDQKSKVEVTESNGATGSNGLNLPFDHLYDTKRWIMRNILAVLYDISYKNYNLAGDGIIYV